MKAAGEFPCIVNHKRKNKLTLCCIQPTPWGNLGQKNTVWAYIPHTSN